MKKVFLGGRLRQLREERNLTQAELARRLDLSPSYLNQIERNQRPLTVQVLLKINAEFGMDVQFFSEEGDARLLAELKDVFTDNDDVATSQLKELVNNLPIVARKILTLHRQYREADEYAKLLALGNDGDRAVLPAPTPFEEVRDFFYDNHNHFDALEMEAEHLFEIADLQIGDISSGLKRYLLEKHGIKLTLSLTPGEGRLRQYDAHKKHLALSRELSPSQRAFQIATQVALLEHMETIDKLIATWRFSGEGNRELARVGLANYFAGAVLMPYTLFWQAAEESLYDIEWLGRQFGTSFEATCHRLSSLQRQSLRGVPFFFLRVDRAGNISKRQSATDFHFSKIGGSCPLWRVHSAFDHPGEILTQIARMPDDRTYFWITRTVSSGHGRYGAPGKTFAIALGCDVQHAHRLVYSKGLDLNDPSAATPIGAGCKVCPREGCTQRAFPMVGKHLQINAQTTNFAPYSA